MAGFFSLDNNIHNNNSSTNKNPSTLTYKNEQIIPSYQWHHHRHQHLPYSSSPIELGILSSSPLFQDGNNESTRSGNCNPTNVESGGDIINSYNFMMMPTMSGCSGSSTISCQDCGNQAKKDCGYMRCRTCCKSRGFDCATHVKSTWVPAAVRRERHQKNLQHQEFIGVNNNQQPKRRRDNTCSSSSSSLVCSQLPVTTNTATFSGMEVGNFPAEVNFPAVFRCVRVTGLDDNDEEFAYQTAVNIGGHVFKGILYDQGPDHQQQQQGGTSSPTYGAGGCDGSYGGNLTMGPTASVGGTTSALPISSSSPTTVYLDPSFYPSPLNAYLSPGTPFFSNPRP